MSRMVVSMLAVFLPLTRVVCRKRALPELQTVPFFPRLFVIVSSYHMTPGEEYCNTLYVTVSHGDKVCVSLSPFCVRSEEISCIICLIFEPGGHYVLSR